MNLATSFKGEARRAKSPQDEAPLTDAPDEDVRLRLSERQVALAQLRGALDLVEENIADIRAAKLLGEPIDSRGLVALGDRQAALQASIAEEESVIAGLQGRVDAWDTAQLQRRHESLRAANEATEAAALALEQAFEAAAFEVVRIGQEHSAVVRTHEIGIREEDELARQLGLPTRPSRRCWRLPTWPNFAFEPPTHGRQDFALWWREWVATRPGFAGHERPVANESNTPWFLRADREGTGLYRVLRNRRQEWANVSRKFDNPLELIADRVVELRHELAAWIERDSAGTLEPAE